MKMSQDVSLLFLNEMHKQKLPWPFQTKETSDASNRSPQQKPNKAGDGPSNPLGPTHLSQEWGLAQSESTQDN